MGQSLYKVLEPEEYSEETSLPTPRFDEAAAQTARPVVPLSDNPASFNPDRATFIKSQRAPQPQRKGSWLLAALVGLVMTAGAMAIGVTTAYLRHNQTMPGESLVPAAVATRIDIDQGSSLTTASRQRATSAVAKPQRRSHIVRQPVSRNPGSRLVDVLH
jgi:hypothetical protein